MDEKEILMDQFNRQAQRFSKWSVTRNIEYMGRYFEFCGMELRDNPLYVACGTGEREMGNCFSREMYF